MGRRDERRGVAGIHIEDQDFPRKCGHLENKVIIALGDYVAKIRAAVSACDAARGPCPSCRVVTADDTRALGAR